MSRRVGGAQLGRDAAIYALGTLLSRLASFVMLPLYTRLLSPEQYGLLQMLDLTVEITSILLSAGAVLGIMRFYYKTEDVRERSAIVVSGAMLLIALHAIGALLLLAFAPVIAQQFLGGQEHIGLMRLAAVNFLMSALPVVPLLLMQIEQRSLLFTISSTGKLLGQVTLNVVFLLGLRLGPEGVLWSTFVANLVLGTILCVWLVRRTGLIVRWSVWKDLQRFGVPHQFGAAAMFVLAFGDRFFLEGAHGLEAVGVYALAYQFGFLLSGIGSGSFLQAWTPQRYQMLALEPAARDAKFNEGLSQFTLVLVTLFVGISIASRPLLLIMSSSSFSGAADLIPLVVLAYLVQGWTAAVHFGIDVSERTKYSAYANWISAAFILVAYALLIPPLGGLGAALATVFGFVVRFVLVLFWATRLYPIAYRWAPQLRTLAVGIGFVTLGFTLRHTGLLVQIGGGAGLCLVYGIVAWAVILEPSARQAVVQRLRQSWPLVGARSHP